MAKVYGIHMLELKPGVTAEEFERFITDELNPAVRAAGFKVHYMKGDRGARAGKYAAMLEFDSLEQRNAAYPAEDQPSAEFQQQTAPLASLLEKWNTLVSGLSDPTTYTDYVVVER